MSLASPGDGLFGGESGLLGVSTRNLLVPPGSPEDSRGACCQAARPAAGDVESPTLAAVEISSHGTDTGKLGITGTSGPERFSRGSTADSPTSAVILDNNRGVMTVPACA